VIARERGIHHLRADTLVENAPMLKVFADSGFEQMRSIDSGVVELSLSTSYAPRSGDPIAKREAAAEEHSLAPLLAPRSVAVIGAGRRPGGIGYKVLLNLSEGGFTGDLYAVNPNVATDDQIAGVPAYLTIADVPGPADLAVVAVPAGDVRRVIDECGVAGVRGAVILSSGFSEAGTDGHAGQRELVRRARARQGDRDRRCAGRVDRRRRTRRPTASG
jgi:predicted CoA-binding protein